MLLRLWAKLTGQRLIDAGLATHTPVVTESKFELLIGEKR